MTNKTFFSLVVIAFILFAGYFVIQLNAKQEDSCIAHFDIECEAYALLACGGEYFAHETASWCEEDTCWGRFEVHCDSSQSSGRSYIFWCSNPGGCANN